MNDKTLLEEARRLEIALWQNAIKAARRYRRGGDADAEARFIDAVALHSKAQRRFERRWRAFAEREGAE